MSISSARNDYPVTGRLTTSISGHPLLKQPPSQISIEVASLNILCGIMELSTAHRVLSSKSAKRFYIE